MQGLLIVVSGVSGVGKGTLMKALLSRYPEEFALSISATSRHPREGEQDGREYFFRTREEFEKMLAENALLEHTEYNGNYYGTPRAFVQEKLNSGVNVILEIEIDGALQIKKKFPEVFLLYVIPPNAAVLYERLKGRGTESPEEIKGRLSRAVEETSYVSQYDCVTVNDDFETCLSEIYKAIKEKQQYREQIREYTETMKKELTELIKGE